MRGHPPVVVLMVHFIGGIAVVVASLYDRAPKNMYVKSRLRDDDNDFI